MIIVLLLILSNNAGGTAMAVYLPVAIGGILISWWLVHTTLSIHYANLYYDDDENRRCQARRRTGFFPHTKQPGLPGFRLLRVRHKASTYQVSDMSAGGSAWRSGGWR